MLYLLLAILLNAYLGIVFILFKKYQIDIMQAIVFNYGACVITGCFVMGSIPQVTEIITMPYFKWSLITGALFISVFNLIAVSSLKVGVTITQTANRLSLIIPAMFSFYTYSESLSMIKAIGILLALIAVLLVSFSRQKYNASFSVWQYFLPLTLFVGSGIIDTITKYVQYSFLNTELNANNYLITAFFTAFLLGIVYLCVLYFKKLKSFSFRYLLAGILLGVPNYFSIYYLVKAFQSGILSSSAVISINNIGVLFVVSMAGIFAFKERLSRLNYAGLTLTIFAILFIYLGDKI
jgi:drug/metabolite transporter (DMT)-like permease